jgi:hypothetical protein
MARHHASVEASEADLACQAPRAPCQGEPCFRSTPSYVTDSIQVLQTTLVQACLPTLGAASRHRLKPVWVQDFSDFGLHVLLVLKFAYQGWLAGGLFQLRLRLEELQ